MPRYEKFFCMYPPRPGKSAIHHRDLGDFPGWVAQRKFNDTRTLIFVSPDGEVTLRNRHREEHRQYSLSPEMEESISSLPLSRGEWSVLDAGLMHSKTRNLKDRIVLWDCLVHDGDYLLGTTYETRLELLQALCSPDCYESETGHSLAWEITPHLWMAETFRDDVFVKRFHDLIDLDEVEGLVLKDPQGRLKPGVSESNNPHWQIRCRKPHKNYSF